MAIRVVTNAHVIRAGGRYRRAVGSILGWALTLSGLLVAVPMVGLIVATFAAGISSRELGTMVLYLGLGIAAVLAGRRLIRGHRRLILFLRRFGFTGSSRALTYAVGTAVGRRFRAVTLDDAELAPIGSRRWARSLLAVASLVTLALLIFVVGQSVRWVTGDALGDVFNSAFESSKAAAAQRGDNPVGALVVGLIGAMVFSTMAGVLALVLLTMFFAVIGSSVAVSASSWIGVMRAEFAKRTTVRRPGEIEHAVVTIAKRARHTFAPRLVVLSSASAVWRDTVRRLARVADIVLVDVSVPSDNLLWEISALKAEHDGRWILIGESDKVEDLVNSASRASGGVAKSLADLLDGDEILTYTTGSRSALREFALSLRASCENVAARAT